jgi:NADH-quinone oxidoreductase subunit N
VGLAEQLYDIRNSLELLPSEILISCAIILLLVAGFIRSFQQNIFLFITMVVCFVSILLTINDFSSSAALFGGMLQKESFSGYLKILVDISALLTCYLSFGRRFLSRHPSEYAALILSIVLGSHLLLMSNNLLMVFLSLEIISISSYVLAGFNSDRKDSEGSLKYFIFGSVASAIMLYGFTILYGAAGTLDFSSHEFTQQIIKSNSTVVTLAGVMAMAGFLFKISAAPMHSWAPDVYESAPIPVVAFFSVAPKLAGIGILAKFVIAINISGQSAADWQAIVCAVAILTLTIGNFAALAQRNAKRMMAYSSIAQSGFLLVGIAALIPQGLHFMLFYATVYSAMNFLVFTYILSAEENGIANLSDFEGLGKTSFWPQFFLLVGLISLTGLPPTGGFTGKLFIFSSLWESYQLTSKPIVLWLLIFGLLNTVVSLFYYLKIPYYAFLKEGKTSEKQNFITLENLLGLILVLLLLAVFFIPGLLMGWINKVNFVF